MAKRNDEGSYPESVVGPSVTIEGDLISKGNLQVEGTVNGKVITSEDLVVGTKARIQADITAENATVAGVVEGNIKVNDTLVISETGKVLGNISCKSLGVKEGAYFSGSCEMHSQPEELSAVEPEEEEEPDEE